MSVSLQSISEKVFSGVPLDFDDGVALFHEPDLLAIGQLANLVRERLHGSVTFYNRNLHLNTTNVCEADCLFCSFSRLKTGMPEASAMSKEQALNWVRER